MAALLLKQGEMQMVEFRKVSPLQLKDWHSPVAELLDPQTIEVGREDLSLHEAYSLLAWLMAVLPCAHNGTRRGTGTLGPGGSIKMTCDLCGAEVPAHVGMLGF